MRRLPTLSALSAALVLATAGPAGACAALIGPNGAVRVARTTTLAAYHQGVEHYVTTFEFVGGGAEFGSIVPLPGVPTKVERGGDWTLQRLLREVEPPSRLAGTAESAASIADTARVLQEVRIDALDLTVLEGGSQAVGRWAKEQGFVLSPDFPEILDFYAQRSPIFLAARYDLSAARARGQQIGDGTPVHLTIPIDNPWVPLRILAAGATPGERVGADLFLLTDREPALLPTARAGLELAASRPASTSLLADLRGDAGMDWVPAMGWLTHLRLDEAAKDLTYDLAVDAWGTGQPSRVEAGFLPTAIQPDVDDPLVRTLVVAVLLLAGLGLAAGALAMTRHSRS